MRVGAVGVSPPHFFPSTARAEQTARDAQRGRFDGYFHTGYFHTNGGQPWLRKRLFAK